MQENYDSDDGGLKTTFIDLPSVQPVWQDSVRSRSSSFTPPPTDASLNDSEDEQKASNKKSSRSSNASTIDIGNIVEKLKILARKYLFVDADTLPEGYSKKPPLLASLVSSNLILHGAFILVSFFLLIFCELLNPTFFNYPYLTFSFMGVLSNWWLFLWCGAISILLWYYLHFIKKAASTTDEIMTTPISLQTHLQKQLVSRFVAGLVEELGHSCFYISTAMVIYAIIHWFLQVFAFWFGFLIIGFGSIAVVYLALVSSSVIPPPRNASQKSITSILVGSLVIIAFGCILFLLSFVYESLSNLWWDWIVFPLSNLLTLYRYQAIFDGLFGSDYLTGFNIDVGRSISKRYFQKNRNFIIGMLLSNFVYKDGNKYKGILGIVNAWFLGWVILATMIRYGLFTALLVRLLCDLVFTVTEYYTLKNPLFFK